MTSGLESTSLPSSSFEDPKSDGTHHFYSRDFLLRLYGSPLVQMPSNMPPLKEWYGEYEPPSPYKPQTVPSGVVRLDQRNGLTAQTETAGGGKIYSRREDVLPRAIDSQNRKSLNGANSVMDTDAFNRPPTSPFRSRANVPKESTSPNSNATAQSVKEKEPGRAAGIWRRGASNGGNDSEKLKELVPVKKEREFKKPAWLEDTGNHPNEFGTSNLPSWMDFQPDSGGFQTIEGKEGLFGTKEASEGIDSIQAWKKEMKEMEKRERMKKETSEQLDQANIAESSQRKEAIVELSYPDSPPSRPITIAATAPLNPTPDVMNEMPMPRRNVDLPDYILAEPNGHSHSLQQQPTGSRFAKIFNESGKFERSSNANLTAWKNNNININENTSTSHIASREDQESFQRLFANLQLQTAGQLQQSPSQVTPSMQRHSQPVPMTSVSMSAPRTLFSYPSQTRDSFIPTVQPNSTTREQILSGLTREHPQQSPLTQLGFLREQSPISSLPPLRDQEASPLAHLNLRETPSQYVRDTQSVRGHVSLSHLGGREQQVLGQVNPVLREQLAVQQQRLGNMGLSGLSPLEQMMLEREAMRNQQLLQRELEIKHHQQLQQQQERALLQQRAAIQEQAVSNIQAQLLQHQRRLLSQQTSSSSIPVQNHGLTPNQLYQLQQAQQAQQAEQIRLARLRDEQLIMGLRDGRINFSDLAQAQNHQRALSIQNRSGYIMTEGRERN